MRSQSVDYATTIETKHLAIEARLYWVVWPGEPMVRYYPDGSGYPGSPPSAELVHVHVIKIIDSKDEWERAGHLEGFQQADRIVEDMVFDNLDAYMLQALEEAAEASDDNRW